MSSHDVITSLMRGARARVAHAAAHRARCRAQFVRSIANFGKDPGMYWLARATAEPDSALVHGVYRDVFDAIGTVLDDDDDALSDKVTLGGFYDLLRELATVLVQDVALVYDDLPEGGWLRAHFDKLGPAFVEFRRAQQDAIARAGIEERGVVAALAEQDSQTGRAMRSQLTMLEAFATRMTSIERSMRAARDVTRTGDNARAPPETTPTRGRVAEMHEVLVGDDGDPRLRVAGPTAEPPTDEPPRDDNAPRDGDSGAARAPAREHEDEADEDARARSRARPDFSAALAQKHARVAHTYRDGNPADPGSWPRQRMPDFASGFRFKSVSARE